MSVFECKYGIGLGKFGGGERHLALKFNADGAVVKPQSRDEKHVPGGEGIVEEHNEAVRARSGVKRSDLADYFPRLASEVSHGGLHVVDLIETVIVCPEEQAYCQERVTDDRWTHDAD
jgi:hypothetical protein